VSQADEVELAMARIKQAGGVNPGVTYLEGGPLLWYTDPKTRSTLAQPLSQIHSVFDVAEHIKESRAKFGGVRP
jgi:hypothetical protein